MSTSTMTGRSTPYLVLGEVKIVRLVGDREALLADIKVEPLVVLLADNSSILAIEFIYLRLLLFELFCC